VSVTSQKAAMFYWVTIMFSQTLGRPLGAVVGDFLDKPHDAGGLALSRYAASVVLLSLIAASIWLFPQKAAIRAH
jgi:uncharacterized membrane-anchored protein